MSSSFVSLTLPGRGAVGFWANDGCLGVWLVALANTVLLDGDGWQIELARHWHEQGVRQDMGCMDVRLDEYMTSEDRRAVAVEFSTRARAMLAGLAEDGYIRPRWLVANGLAFEGCTSDRYHRDGLRLAHVTQISDAFINLLHGRLVATAATAPVLPSL